MIAPEKVSRKVLDIVQDKRNEVFVSTVSYWEISLKYGIGKLKLKNYEPEDFDLALEEMHIGIIGLSERDSLTFYHLRQSERHRDPFDRMLAWQAITRDLTLISDDEALDEYRAQGLRILW
jgi:PIN domain nuclease of toxin-antitoxin system